MSRIAGGPLAEEFERFVLLAPYLGYRAPTNRPNDGEGRWVAIDMPRVIALVLLDKCRASTGRSRCPCSPSPTRPKRSPFVTPSYSYRLMRNYAAPDDWQAPFDASGAKMVVIAGADDELMNAPAYKAALEPYWRHGESRARRRSHGHRLQPAALGRDRRAAAQALGDAL